MLRFLRPYLARMLLPVGRGLARVGVTPTAVTLTGAVGVTVSSLAFYPQGKLYIGSVVVTAFVLCDMLDGAVARVSNGTSKWGAFLDSTLDRVSDAAILAGLLLWFTGEGADPMLAGLTLFCMVSGFGVSYVKARAEGLGVNCDVGVAGRSERLVLVLVAAGIGGLDVPYVLPVGLWLLAVLSGVTVVQRLLETYNRLTHPNQHAGNAGTH
ncbi:CDP-diacylglycerol--glycerol-3-phosphate 3-phosphatidyltransferase [Haloactinospora alba]|uniref:Phosphatidylinositol phosphate synthase n=1 Tax=Haloactinospora alba TaxID=405555 RepID=A0A543NHA7_9ACTN|nr:CDP-alcohol phosphatidyltransferase family protein [Haloactinospora alba]TQN31236.1 CDP-diacylglycerol--glycerol-3-phosphate 3-phosphatidyltransferase [Haloactinospora alba]